MFGNLGLADKNPSPFRWSTSIGLGGSSPFACREQDSFGIGYFYLGVNDALKQLAPNLLPIQNEQGVELFYNVAATRWFHLTPDFQVIVPGRERADTLLFLGLRAKVDF